MTFEQYLRSQPFVKPDGTPLLDHHGNPLSVIDFAIRVASTEDGVDFYIHPMNQSGETADFHVVGNSVEPRR